MKHRILRFINKLLHPIKVIAKKYNRYRILRNEANYYHVWANEHEGMCFVEDDYEAIKISVLVPAFNTNSEHLSKMVNSVLNQHFQNWELVIVNASTNKESRSEIDKLTQKDTRIKIVNTKENIGISGNTNKGLKVTSGKYIAFLDHDDVLHPCALHCIADSIRNTNADIIYTDEDKITDDGNTYFNPFLKPDWSKYLFENVNYINHLSVIKSELISKAGGLRPEFDGAQDY
ncbi:MAG: glycosyltransferase, partial [Candidatus Riesia sp.]|nr:glycosyltransferase [Candidatus Riesia sp.]